MHADVSIEEVDALPLAAVRRRVPRASITETILGSPVWTLVRQRQLEHLGLNVVVYRGGSGGEIEMDVGVLLKAPFAGDDALLDVTTPAGRAAHAQLIGGYHGLSGIHRQLRDWSADHCEQVTGVNWEIYGHWNENPALLVTDVYYLLR